MKAVKLRRSINKQQKETHTIIAYKLKKQEIEEGKAETIIPLCYDEPITSTEIVFTGDLNRFYKYQEIVQKLNRKFQGKSIYRNYCVSLERQLQTMMFVNVCEDADTSWNTVKSALGAMNNKSECLGAIAIIIHKE